jgi:hypothetical protein
MLIYKILFFLCLISLVFGNNNIISDSKAEKIINCILHIKNKNSSKTKKCMDKHYYKIY